jgi:hypothetical protein
VGASVPTPRPLILSLITLLIAPPVKDPPRQVPLYQTLTDDPPQLQSPQPGRQLVNGQIGRKSMGTGHEARTGQEPGYRCDGAIERPRAIGALVTPWLTVVAWVKSAGQDNCDDDSEQVTRSSGRYRRTPVQRYLAETSVRFGHCLSCEFPIPQVRFQRSFEFWGHRNMSRLYEGRRL